MDLHVGAAEPTTTTMVVESCSCSARWGSPVAAFLMVTRASVGSEAMEREGGGGGARPVGFVLGSSNMGEREFHVRQFIIELQKITLYQS